MSKQEFDEPFYSITDYRTIDGVIVGLIVAVDDDFTPYTKNYSNPGYFEIYLDKPDKIHKNSVIWDGLGWFICKNVDEIKDDCKKELLEKKLHRKGIYRLMKEMIAPFVERGYLK